MVFGDVDHAIGEDVVADIDAGDLAEGHEIGRTWQLLNADEFALQGCGGQCDAGWLDCLALGNGKLGFLEFVGAFGEMHRACVHAVCQSLRDDIDHEFAGVTDVAEAVFGLVDTDFGLGGGEHDHRRGVSDAIEEGVGREVDLAVVVDRGDPADGARSNEGVEWVVGEAVILKAGAIEHGFGLDLTRVPLALRAC